MFRKTSLVSYMPLARDQEAFYKSSYQSAQRACWTIVVLVQQRSALPVHSLFTSVLSHEHRVGQLPQAQGQHSCPSPRIKPSDAARDEEGV
jgi:hypothetical protein